VLEVAQQNAQAMSIADRYHLLPGSAFEIDFGSGYDLALITNFLHHFDPPTCTTFMRKVHAALVPAGRVAIAEFVPNPDRVTPPTAAAFSMMMCWPLLLPATLTLSQSWRAYRKVPALRELSSRPRKSASIAWSSHTGEFMNEEVALTTS
jgi:ubiquinone/menaquinone biosynthesis C-methylase UbiE